MSDDLPDSLFKLRLTGPLRKRLEGEAAKRGLTLTAEILRRIEETLSDTTDRISALEREVFDKGKGNDALDGSVTILKMEMSALQARIAQLEIGK